MHRAVAAQNKHERFSKTQIDSNWRVNLTTEVLTEKNQPLTQHAIFERRAYKAVLEK